MTFFLDTTVTLPLLASLFTLLFAWFRTRRSAVDERFKEGRARMDRHEARIASLEQSIQAMPVKDDLHALQLELARQTGALGEMNAHMVGHAKIMERLESIVSRHEDHLLGGKR